MVSSLTAGLPWGPMTRSDSSRGRCAAVKRQPVGEYSPQSTRSPKAAADAPTEDSEAPGRAAQKRKAVGLARRTRRESWPLPARSCSPARHLASPAMTERRVVIEECARSVAKPGIHASASHEASQWGKVRWVRGSESARRPSSSAARASATIRLTASAAQTTESTRTGSCEPSSSLAALRARLVRTFAASRRAPARVLAHDGSDGSTRGTASTSARTRSVVAPRRRRLASSSRTRKWCQAARGTEWKGWVPPTSSAVSISGILSASRRSRVQSVPVSSQCPPPGLSMRAHTPCGFLVSTASPEAPTWRKAPWRSSRTPTWRPALVEQWESRVVSVVGHHMTPSGRSSHPSAR